jgi:hypothetical protein
MEFRRINGLPPYVFATINDLKAASRRAGRTTSSTSVSAIRICPRRWWRWRNWPRRRTIRGTIATPLVGVSPSCAAPWPISTSASSTSRSTPTPRWSRPSGPRKASRTSCGSWSARATPRWCPRRRIRSTSGDRSSRARTCVRCRSPARRSTSRGSARPTRAKPFSTGSCTPGRSPGPSRESSCSRSPTIRPRPVSTCRSWSGWWPLPVSTRSSWCTTSPMRTSGSTATNRRPSCRFPEPRTWRSSSTP